MPLFGHRAVVVIDTLRVDGLDVRFDVTLQEDNLGKALIEIFNLNNTHREQIGRGTSFNVTLSAGYIDHDLTDIFKGTIRVASSRRDNSDWITSLKAGDGDEVAGARIAKTYPAGATFESAWKDGTDALKSAGLGIGNAIEAFKKGIPKDGVTQFLHGGIVHGPAFDQLKKLARMHGLKVDIQNKELLVVPIGQPLDSMAIVLSPTSGLIGSPEKARNKDRGVYMKARALIMPGLLPRRKVHIKSALIDSLYVVRKVQYKGDTSGQDWYADLECEAL